MKYDDETMVLDNKDLLKDNKSDTEILEDALVRETSYDEFERKYLKMQKSDTFVGKVRALMFKNDFDTRKMLSITGMSKSYYYQLLNGERSPSRDSVIIIAIALNCDIDGCNELLKLSEKQSLYAKNKRDSLIIFAIANNYSVGETNKFLAEHEEQILWK